VHNQEEQANRRWRKDRRRIPTSLLSKYVIYGRRKFNRRRSDQLTNYYVDRYGIKSVVAFIIILILCVVDAKITILILEEGGIEVNPLMRFAMKMGPVYFQIIKYMITCACLVLLIIHKNFILLDGKLNVKSLVKVILILYVLLVIYEVCLYVFLI